MDHNRLSKDERKELRDKTLEALNNLNPERGDEVASLLLPLLVPDPSAEAGRNGLRTSREVIAEIADAVLKKVSARGKLDSLVSGLWRSGTEESRTAAATCIGPLLRAPNEQGEAESVERVRGYVAESGSRAVRDVLADAVSREVEAGRGESWTHAFSSWRLESDPRFRSFGPMVYSSLFSRGKSPEKLFDGLQVARGLIGDPDPDVRKAVVNLMAAGARKQGPAVERFLTRFDEDEREEVRSLVKETRGRIRK